MNHTYFDTARLRALDVDAGAVLAAVERDGTLNGRFLFLTLACPFTEPIPTTISASESGIYANTWFLISQKP